MLSSKNKVWSDLPHDMIHEELGCIAEPGQQGICFAPLYRPIVHQGLLTQEGIMDPFPMLPEAFSIGEIVEHTIPAHTK